MMTNDQKAEMERLRSLGYGYRIIAKQMGFSLERVKSYFRRHSTPVREDGVNCLKCGALLTQTPGHKRKKFCSDKCRLEYWSTVPESDRNLTKHSHVCEMCGCEFENTRRNQRFCSRKCMADYRRGGISNNAIPEENEKALQQDGKQNHEAIITTFLQRLDTSTVTGRERLQNLSPSCLCSICPWMVNGERRCQGDRNTDPSIPASNRESQQ